MKISGFQKLTLLDYPGKVACIIFTQGCNFRCPYCQNSLLIPMDSDYLIDEEEVFSYLNKRKGVIDGLVISGGEPTLQKDLVKFIKRVKDMGFLVKLDTNGSNPKILQELIDNDLVDYIAMDIKYLLNDYKVVAGLKVIADKLDKSINIIKKSNISHEFRTVIIKNIHDVDIILKISNYIGKDEKYYLQNFEKSESVIDKTLESFSEEELINIERKVKKENSNIEIRGL